MERSFFSEKKIEETWPVGGAAVEVVIKARTIAGDPLDLPQLAQLDGLVERLRETTDGCVPEDMEPFDRDALPERTYETLREVELLLERVREAPAGALYQSGLPDDLTMKLASLKWSDPRFTQAYWIARASQTLRSYLLGDTNTFTVNRILNALPKPGVRAKQAVVAGTVIIAGMQVTFSFRTAPGLEYLLEEMGNLIGEVEDEQESVPAADVYRDIALATKLVELARGERFLTDDTFRANLTAQLSDTLRHLGVYLPEFDGAKWFAFLADNRNNRVPVLACSPEDIAEAVQCVGEWLPKDICRLVPKVAVYGYNNEMMSEIVMAAHATGPGRLVMVTYRPPVQRGSSGGGGGEELPRKGDFRPSTDFDLAAEDLADPNVSCFYGKW